MPINQKILLQIWYVIFFDENPSEELTINEYFKEEILTHEIMAKIITLPKNVAEVFCKKEMMIRDRLSGAFDGYLIDFQKGASNINKSPYKIKVIFISNFDQISEIIQPAIFVSSELKTNKSIRLFNINDINTDLLKYHIQDILQSFTEEEQGFYAELKHVVGYEEQTTYISSDITINESLYTSPNIRILESLRMKLKTIANDPFDFVEADLNQSINIINYIRNGISKNLNSTIINPPITYYITDMSSNMAFMIDKKEFFPSELEKKGVKNSTDLHEAITAISGNKFKTSTKDNPYTDEYLTERNYLNNLISLNAASNVSPVIVIPFGIKNFYENLSSLGKISRSSDTRKINKVMKKIKDDFAKGITDSLEYFDEENISRVKIVSNLPLEWSNHYDTPIMIRHEVSRIPNSPGYVTSNLLLDTEKINVPIDSLRKILVISSFNDGDAIKDNLTSIVSKIRAVPTNEKINNFLTKIGRNDLQIPQLIENKFQIDIEYKKVSRVTDLKEVLISNNSSIVVFDMHGGHGNAGTGFLSLEEENVSIFELANQIIFPPIVILSACDTSAVDKNHYSTAAAFFYGGTKTVLSSALPINSPTAAIFIGRLIQRLEYMVPEVIEKGFTITWASIVSGMLRRSYYYELIELLQEEYKFDSSKKSALLFDINSMLDPLRPNWVNDIKKKITTSLTISGPNLDNFIAQKFQIPECLKYTQMGNPELIVVTPREMLSTNDPHTTST